MAGTGYDTLPLCHPDQLWIKVGLMSIHYEQQRALLTGKLQEVLDKPLPEQLTVHVPCWRLPVEGIGNPLFIVGAPWIFPLVDYEAALSQARTVMWSLFPWAYL